MKRGAVDRDADAELPMNAWLSWGPDGSSEL